MPVIKYLAYLGPTQLSLSKFSLTSQIGPGLTWIGLCDCFQVSRPQFENIYKTVMTSRTNSNNNNNNITCMTASSIAASLCCCAIYRRHSRLCIFLFSAYVRHWTLSCVHTGSGAARRRAAQYGAARRHAACCVIFAALCRDMPQQAARPGANRT